MIARRHFVCTQDYLNIPIKTGASGKAFRLFCGGAMIRSGFLELAEGPPDFWVFIYLGLLRGQEACIEVEGLPMASRLPDRFEMSDEIRGVWPMYREPVRPYFHFAPRRGWIGDPNGLVFYQGEYHLFFQHNPYGLEPNWGGIGWGHAVSTDLIRWQELDDALFPDDSGAICSGTAVIDHMNTSGLGENGAGPMLLFYTAAREQGFVQGMAYSNDGRSFRKFPQNPVVPQIRWGNRDPKVFWHGASGHWVMALYVPGEAESWAQDDLERPLFRYEVHFLTSSNLREWQPASVFAGGLGNDFSGVDRFLYECVDLFSLPVQGDSSESKWIITAADGAYTLGQFDGDTFTADSGWRSPGRPEVFYAAQTFNDEPQGRRIQMGFLRAPTPGMPFNQCLSVPTELSLRPTAEGLRLCSWPVPELNVLRRGSHIVPAGPLVQGENPLQQFRSPAFDMEIVIAPHVSRWIVFGLNRIHLTYDVSAAELVSCGIRLPLRLDSEGQLALRFLVDRTSLEVFGGNGLFYFPIELPFSPDAEPPVLTTVGGTALIRRLVLYEMVSAWEPQV